MLEFGIKQIKYNTSGIYKITSPTKKVYIGQSVDIKKRFLAYRRLKAKSQPRLNNSFLKYGIVNHKFEVLITCNKDELNKFESYYQGLYNSTSRSGLNCILVSPEGKICTHSKETIDKIKKSCARPEYRQMLRDRNLGKKHSIETKKRISEVQIGRTSPRKGCRLTDAQKQKIREIESVCVLNIETGIYYPSIKEAAYSINRHPSIVAKQLSGFTKTKKVPFIYAN